MRVFLKSCTALITIKLVSIELISQGAFINIRIKNKERMEKFQPKARGILRLLN